jgi:hypothetical protein
MPTRAEFKELADHRIIPVGTRFLFRYHHGAVGEPAKHHSVTLAKGEHLADRGRHGRLAARGDGSRISRIAALFAFANCWHPRLQENLM